MQFQCINYHCYILKALLEERLNEDKQKRPEQEMVITFEPGLQETAEQLYRENLVSFILQLSGLNNVYILLLSKN